MIRLPLTVALALVAIATVPGPASAAPAREPRCFGAAARDASRPCTNPRLRLRVTPTPNQAALIPNLACQRSTLTEVLDECAYGLAAAQARETVAVIGDSHAAHWRAALRVVAERKRWRVLEIARPHCPLSLAEPHSGEPISSQCATWNTQVIGWLEDHPEVRTVFVTGAARAPIVVPKGRTRFQERVAGFVGAWKRLPASVAHLIVIRDNATEAVDTHDCVRRAMRRRVPAGPACALPGAGPWYRTARSLRRASCAGAACGSSTSRLSSATPACASRSSAACSSARTRTTSRSASPRRWGRSCCAS